MDRIRHRIGAVKYLNTKPLIEGLAQENGVDLVLDLPSRLADRLLAHTIDVGLLPIVDFLAHPEFGLIPGISISCAGPVLSVQLFSRVPLEKVLWIDADVGSHTSIALCQLLIQKTLGLLPQMRPFPLEADPNHSKADAVLLIGDRALSASLPDFPFSFDLGWEWQKLTGLPMVFAVWATRPKVDVQALECLLKKAKQRGLANLPRIAHQASQELNLDGAICRKYLEHIIRYDLGPKEVLSVSEFARLAQNLNLLPQRINTSHASPFG